MQANLDYIADSRAHKVNAGIGMIMDPKTGKPFVSKTLQKIGKEIAFDDNGYLPSHGHEAYLSLHAKHLIFGNDLWEAMHTTTVKAQTIGGTNALELAGEILKMGLNKNNWALLLDTGWPNHPKIFKDFIITDYVHEDPHTRQYDHDAYIKALKNHDAGSMVLLQVGGYNDDGTERNNDQWDEIAEIIAGKNVIPILDFAYNGLVNGWEEDNYPVRLFVKKGIITFVCASNSKNVAYNARLGALYIVNLPSSAAQNIQSTLANTIIRPFFSNPPAFAAQTFARILADDTLRSEYQHEVEEIRVTLLEKNRQTLAAVLGEGFEWITARRGMFLKLKPDGWTDTQIKYLKDDNAIHGPQNSRLNMGGFNPEKMEEIAGIYKKTLLI